jgi:hypothetical protein
LDKLFLLKEELCLPYVWSSILLAIMYQGFVKKNSSHICLTYKFVVL